MPYKIIQKIQYLCELINSDEWSGVLLYEIKGKFESNFECIVKDIYPMDMGNSGSTEYEFDEDFVKYRMNNLKSLEWNVGHVHSHHNMNTFFSGTDMSELHDNAPNHNYYLSLIVNNAGNMTAKIAFIGEEDVSSSIKRYIPNKDGELQEKIFDYKKKEKVLFIYDCKIIKDSPRIDNDFVLRVDHIIEKEKARARRATKKNYATQATYYSNIPGQQYIQDFEDPMDCPMDNSLNSFDWNETDDGKLRQLLIDSLVGGACETVTLEEAIKTGYESYSVDSEDYLEWVQTFFHSMRAFHLDESKIKDEDFIFTSTIEILENSPLYEEYNDFLLEVIESLV